MMMPVAVSISNQQQDARTIRQRHPRRNNANMTFVLQPGSPLLRMFVVSLLLVLLFLGCFCCQAQAQQTSMPENNNNSDNEESIRVTVRFATVQDRDSYWDSELATPMANNNGYRSSTSTTSTSTGPERRKPQQQRLYRYQRSPAVAMTISASQWATLDEDPRIASVQRDARFVLYQRSRRARESVDSSKAFEREIIPYGIQAVQGTSPSTVIPTPVSFISDCSNPDSFKVCIIDSGLMVDHNDIPYDYNGTTSTTTSNTNIRGSTFGLSDDENDNIHWYNPSAASSHGTHVAGTILAQANNGLGVAGILPNAPEQGICLLVARTFDESGYQDESFITEAVEWCADQGARVINMSLGSTEKTSDAHQQVYERIFKDDGILVISAAGNDGTNQYAYPASLDTVISVAAADEMLMQRANFSQHNDRVDLAAPGVNILSTISSNAVRINAVNVLVTSALMKFSPDLPEDLILLPLEWVDCGQGFYPCPNATGKACIMERGVSFFWEKALNCQDAGGVTALIYNNVEGSYGGSLLSADVGVVIPIFSISREDGLFLLEQRQPDNGTPTTRVTLQAASASYGFLDGTSMAAPHVAGAAVKIWAARPACTNAQIREALEKSALDLGVAGKDPQFGYGLVQAESAFEYLLATFEPPCGGGVAVEEENSGEAAVPTDNNCAPNFMSCTSNDDCCSGRCVPSTFQSADLICRAAPYFVKNKLSSGDGRGGAGGTAMNGATGGDSSSSGGDGNRRLHGGPRGDRVGDKSGGSGSGSGPQSIRGSGISSSSNNKNNNTKNLPNYPPGSNNHHEPREMDAVEENIASSFPFQDKNSPYVHRNTISSGTTSTSKSYQTTRSLEGIVTK